MNAKAKMRTVGMLFLVLAACDAVCAATNASQRTQAEESVDGEPACREHLKHANTLYWLGRARPWSSIEARLALEQFDLAQQSLESAPAADRDALARQIENGRRQTSTILGERSEQLSAWSPYFGIIFDHDQTFEWYDEPFEVAATRMTADLLSDRTRLHMQNDQSFLIVQSDLGDPWEGEFGASVREAAHSYINQNTLHYAISVREMASVLSQAELDALQENPPDRNAIEKLAEGLSSPEMTVDRIGIITFVHNDELGDLHYLGGYYQQWPAKSGVGGAEREWYVDGFIQDVEMVEALILVLFLLGLLMQPAIVTALRSAKLDHRSLEHSPRPPLWAIGFSILGGFAFAGFGRLGLIAASPPLEALHPTLFSAVWIAGTAIVISILPIALVYVAATRFNSIAGRLGNSDMVAVLLAGSWYGTQLHLLVYVAPVEGLNQATALLLFPAASGIVALSMTSISLCRWSQSGNRWELATTIAALLALTATAILELRGTWPTAVAASLFPPATYLLFVTAKKIRSGFQTDEITAESNLSDSDQIRNPPFIETLASTELFETLNEGILGDAAADDAIEVAWIEGDRGSGKTRIARELARRLGEHHTKQVSGETIVLFGDCNEPGDPEADVPFEPLKQAFSELMGVHRFGNPAENARRVQESLSKIASNASIAGSAISAALDLTGSDESSFTAANEGMIADEMAHVLGQTVRPTAETPAGKRIVLILDDIQWIDDDSLRVLNILMERLVDQFVSGEPNMRNRVCIVITCRSDVGVDGEGKNENAIDAFEKLTEMQKRDLVRLIQPPPVHETLGTDENSVEWRSNFLTAIHCTERARRGITRELEQKGIELPLHRIEFVKIAMEQNALMMIDGKLDLDPTTPLEEISPGSEFHEMVANELKGLEPRLIEILHCCAIIGLRFQVSLAAKIFNLDIIDLLSLLKKAEARGIVADCTETDDIFEFRDKRIAGAFRVTPDSMNSNITQLAKEYHRRLLDVKTRELDEKYAHQSSIPFAEVLGMAHHASMVSESMPNSTIRWSRMAALRCEQRKLFGRAIRELSPALDLIAGRHDLAISTDDRIAILLMHSRIALDAELHPGVVLESLDEAERLIAKSDSELDAQVALFRGLAMYRQREFKSATAAVEDVAADPAAPLWMRLRAEFIVILCLDPRKQAEDKHQRLEMMYESLTDAEMKSDDHDQNRQLMLLRSEVCNSVGFSRLHHANEGARAAEAFEEAIKLNQDPAVADRKGEAIGHGGLGDVHLANDRVAEATESYEMNLLISRETGDAGGIMRMTSMLGRIALQESAASGSDEERLRLLERGRRLYEESAFVATKERNPFALRFAIDGLVKVEIAEHGTGLLTLRTIEEAIEMNCMNSTVAAAVIEMIGNSEFQVGARERITSILEPLCASDG